MKIKNILMSLALLTIVTGCSTRIVDLTVASTKNMDLASNGLVTAGRVTGADTVPIIFNVPIGRIDMKEAIDNAIEKDSCGVGLADVVVSHEFFAFIFGYVEYNVEGNLIIDSGVNGCSKYADPNYVKPAPIVD